MKMRVVTIGGGTGNFVVLNGLRNYEMAISAIVSMADDGGSTGVLRDELGVLPAGDARQCIVALSNSSLLMRNLMNYRFETGGLAGHSFGNLFLSALEKVTGSFEKAIEEVGKIVKMCGNVLPVTTQQVRLRMVLADRSILEGEKEIYLSEKIEDGYKSIYLEPSTTANPLAIQEIMRADAIVIGPGGLYTSLVANFLVEGVSEAIRKSKAKKIFIVNLMNRRGQTTGFSVSDYVRELSHYLGGDVFDYILVNSETPPPELIEEYRNEGDLIQNDMEDDPRVLSYDLLGGIAQKQGGDTLARSLIRHHSEKLAEALVEILAKDRVEK